MAAAAGLVFELHRHLLAKQAGNLVPHLDRPSDPRYETIAICLGKIMSKQYGWVRRAKQALRVQSITPQDYQDLRYIFTTFYPIPRRVPPPNPPPRRVPPPAGGGFPPGVERELQDYYQAVDDHELEIEDDDDDDRRARRPRTPPRQDDDDTDDETEDEDDEPEHEDDDPPWPPRRRTQYDAKVRRLKRNTLIRCSFDLCLSIRTAARRMRDGDRRRANAAVREVTTVRRRLIDCIDVLSARDRRAVNVLTYFVPPGPADLRYVVRPGCGEATLGDGSLDWTPLQDAMERLRQLVPLFTRQYPAIDLTDCRVAALGTPMRRNHVRQALVHRRSP